MAPIITSLLDTDLYKFTMWQAMLHRNPQTEAEYEFVCRTKTAFPLAELLPEVERELDALCALRFTPEDLAYLGGLRFMKSDFIDFLRIFQFQRAFIRAWADGIYEGARKQQCVVGASGQCFSVVLQERRLSPRLDPSASAGAVKYGATSLSRPGRNERGKRLRNMMRNLQWEVLRISLAAWPVSDRHCAVFRRALHQPNGFIR